MSPALDPTTLVEKAETLVKGNHLKDALSLYSDWLRDVLCSMQLANRYKESIAVAFNNRGHLKYLLVDFDGAVEDYNAGLEYNSLLPCLYYNRGTIMYRMGHFDKSVEDMMIAARLAPDCTDFQVALQRCTDELVRVNGPLLPKRDDSIGGEVDPLSPPGVKSEDVETLLNSQIKDTSSSPQQKANPGGTSFSSPTHSTNK